MAKRKHGRVALKKIQPRLLDLLRKDQARVMRVLEAHGVYFDPTTYLSLIAPLDKLAAYHAVPDKKKFLRDLLGR